MYLNKVLIYGNLTRDPELRALPSGQQVATFSVATNRTYKDKEGNKKEMNEFHNVVVFGRLADLMGQYMKKGRPIYVEGRLQTRSWESDGRKNYRTEIVMENFQFGADATRGGSSTSAPADPSASSSVSAESASSSETIQYPDEDIKPEDIPF